MREKEVGEEIERAEEEKEEVEKGEVKEEVWMVVVAGTNTR